MKKSMLAFAAASLMIGFASCSDKNAAASDEDAEFLDSLVTINGEAMGAHFATFLNNPDAPKKFDKSSVMRGISDVLKCDTADLSYFVGLQMGMEVFQNYMGMATTVDGVDRQKLLEAIRQTVMADSVELDIAQLRMDASNLNRRMQDIKNKKDEEARYNSPEGVQNRKAGDEFFKKLTDVVKANDGIVYKTNTPGNDKVVGSKARVLAKYTITTLKGDTITSTGNDVRNMYVQGAPIEGLVKALQLMHEGEDATFYIPWNLAYGAMGIPSHNVGPCESIILHLNVTQIPNE
jgi:FKBP-type peptidyl-prolyl cis-trans isomerase